MPITKIQVVNYHELTLNNHIYVNMACNFEGITESLYP